MDRNIALITHFKCSTVVLVSKKLKKEKWQCSQNLDLNLTYQFVKYVIFQHLSLHEYQIDQEIFFQKVLKCWSTPYYSLKFVISICGEEINIRNVLRKMSVKMLQVQY